VKLSANNAHLHQRIVSSQMKQLRSPVEICLSGSTFASKLIIKVKLEENCLEFYVELQNKPVLKKMHRERSASGVGRRENKNSRRRRWTEGTERYFLTLIFKEDMQSDFSKQMCQYSLPSSRFSSGRHASPAYLFQSHEDRLY
jgi:hypothetical protein